LVRHRSFYHCGCGGSTPVTMAMVYCLPRLFYGRWSFTLLVANMQVWQESFCHVGYVGYTFVLVCAWLYWMAGGN